MGCLASSGRTVKHSRLLINVSAFWRSWLKSEAGIRKIDKFLQHFDSNRELEAMLACRRPCLFAEFFPDLFLNTLKALHELR
jgi:hypothetical protein